MPNKDLGSDKSKLCTYLKSVLRVQKEQILIMIMTCMAGFEKSTGKNNTFFAVMKYFLIFEYQYFGTISTYFTTRLLGGEKEAEDPDKGHPNWFPGSGIFFVAKTFIKIQTSRCHNSALTTGNIYLEVYISLAIFPN